MKNDSLNKGVLRGLATLLLLLSFSVSAQSLTGTRGLIKAPTARMYESGTLAIGMGYVPPKFFTRTFNNPPGTQGLRTGNAGLNTFITVNVTSFLEVMFRYSHELNMNVTPATKYFPDRMFTARFKIIQETKTIPQIVLGFHDVSGAIDLTSSYTNFGANYIVGSKIFNLKKFSLDISAGYSADLDKIKSRDIKGFFGGIEVKYNEFDKAQLLIDYDTKSLNIGVQGYLFNRIHTVLGIMDFEPMFILAYRYKI